MMILPLSTLVPYIHRFMFNPKAPVNEAALPMEKTLLDLHEGQERGDADLTCAHLKDIDSFQSTADASNSFYLEGSASKDLMSIDVDIFSSPNLDPLKSRQGRTDFDRPPNPAPTTFDRIPSIPGQDANDLSRIQASIDNTKTLVLQRIMQSATLGSNVKKYIATKIIGPRGRERPLEYPLSQSQQLAKYRYSITS